MDACLSWEDDKLGRTAGAIVWRVRCGAAEGCGEIFSLCVIKCLQYQGRILPDFQRSIYSEKISPAQDGSRVLVIFARFWHGCGYTPRHPFDACAKIALSVEASNDNHGTVEHHQLIASVDFYAMHASFSQGNESPATRKNMTVLTTKQKQHHLTRPARLSSL